jgi:hypothetical protein
MRIPTLVLALALLAPAVVRAQPVDNSYGDDGDAYCLFTRSQAKADSALLFSPQIFLDYGVVNGNDVSTGAGGITTSNATQRLTLGARFSLMGMARGIVIKQRAERDCERYHAQSGLARFLVENREQVSPAALDARLAVLRGALPKAREILRDLKRSVERARATVEELGAAQLRVDDIETQAATAEALGARLPSRSSVTGPSQLLEKHRAADAEVGKYEARLRLLTAVDVSVRGGYDRFFGLRDDLPLFGVISLTINPAAFYLPFVDSDAARARAKVLRLENDALEQKAELLTARLKQVLAQERRRMGEVRVLLADVESRLRAVEAIDSDKLRRFKEATWFDWVRLKSEAEFLRVHVGELQATLGEDGGG